MTISSALKYLKNIGLLMATISSIWTTTNVISKEKNNTTEKILTPAGQISLALTIFGLLLTVTSNILEDKEKAQKAIVNAQQELKRTRKIILASQPLNSLQFIWKFRPNKAFDECFVKTFNNFIEQHSSQQGEVSESKGQGISRLYSNAPLFGASLFGEIAEGGYHNFLMLISFGINQSAVFSYGILSDNLRIYDHLDSGDIVASLKNKSKGILFDDDVLRGAHIGIDIHINEPIFQLKNSVNILNWFMDPLTLAECIDKTNQYVTLTANLPEEIKVAFLYNLSSLPTANGNLTTIYSSIWDHSENETMAINSIYLDSSMEIIPNEISEEKSKYELFRISPKTVFDKDWEEIKICESLLITYKKIN